MKTTIEKITEQLQSINDETIVRVYPSGEFKANLFGKWMIISDQGRFAYWSKKFHSETYTDETHRGKQGSGFVAWRNGDFPQPFNMDCLYVNDFVRDNFIEISEEV